MGQFLYSSAKTTRAIRAELQRSKAPTAALARRYGINEKTVREMAISTKCRGQRNGSKGAQKHVPVSN